MLALCIWIFIICLYCRFIITYLQRNGSPFQRIPLFSKLEKNEFKKRKKMLPEWYEEVLKATYLLVMVRIIIEIFSVLSSFTVFCKVGSPFYCFLK